MPQTVRVIAALCLFFGLGGISEATEKPDVVGRQFAARDTLDANVDPNADAQACLEGLCWKPASFTVTCEPATRWQYDALVRFPSPRPSGVATADNVAMEWHMARDEAGEIIAAPAMIVVHESGRGMDVGRAIAYLLSRAGLHTFLIQMPGYGVRDYPQDKSAAEFLRFVAKGSLMRGEPETRSRCCPTLRRTILASKVRAWAGLSALWPLRLTGASTAFS